MLAFKNPGIETVGSSVSHHLSTKHRGSCRVSSFYIYSSGTFPAWQEASRDQASWEMPTVCKTMTTRERRQPDPCPSLCRVSSALPNAVPEFWLQFLGNFGDIHMAIQCYSATQLSVSKAQATQCHVRHVSSMSRPCLARMLLLQICKSLLVSEWVATPGTEGECFYGTVWRGFFNVCQISQIHTTHTYFQVFQRVQQPSTRLRKAGPSLVKVDSPTLKSYPRGILPTMCPYYLIVVLRAVLNVEMQFFLMQCRTIFGPQDSKMCGLSCILMSHNPVSHLSKVIHV